MSFFFFFVEFELLTVVESQMLRASKIQLRYKNLFFRWFSCYRQSPKTSNCCQPDLANGKIASKL